MLVPSQKMKRVITSPAITTPSMEAMKSSR